MLQYLDFLHNYIQSFHRRQPPRCFPRTQERENCGYLSSAAPADPCFVFSDCRVSQNSSPSSGILDSPPSTV
ncbi:hypothetical protein COCON_G00076240 [Conger conger]|uniref:Uncharacterized protein n=1 Tax=Conger conger TaxID=82655 RepID=A0A9Q1I234_CONCO|nr:hypothetical protein COCON_G00076240 [Conger conger]